jgi:hypothetical protein
MFYGGTAKATDERVMADIKENLKTLHEITFQEEGKPSEFYL